MFERSRSKALLLAIVLVCINTGVLAQNLLNKVIALDVNHQRLDQVLEILSNKGNFYFSYNSNIIKRDSLVTLSVTKPVKQILDVLLPDHYEFRESGNYIIIRKAPIRITIVTNKAVTEDNYYMVSGYVLDDETGMQIKNASIYEKNQLASTLTNTNGYFRLKLKHKSRSAALTVSKEYYQDTTVAIDPGYNQQLTITIIPLSVGSVTIISPEDYFAPDELKVRVKKDSTVTEYTYVKSDSVRVEHTAMGRFLLSSSQRIRSMNLKKFFVTRPFQVSVVPGLSTHGGLSAQVTNNFSMNIFGGYNGGVNGAEIGGLFNIDKGNVQFVQLGGLFNVVGGYMKGLQVGGISNTVLDSAKGIQLGGIDNIVRGNVSGLQVGGIYNHAGDHMNGVQIGGIANFVAKDVRGVQIGGIVNYTKKLKGLQIGLINIADTSEGYSIGLINIILKGYHKISISTDDIVHLNAAFKTGNTNLYSIVQAGMNLSQHEKLYTFGYGIGSERRLGKTLTLNPELSAQYMYLGSWDYTNILSKARVNLNLHVSKYVSFFAGPVFNVYYSNQYQPVNDFKFSIPPSSYHTYNFGSNVNGWIGWNVGITVL